MYNVTEFCLHNGNNIMHYGMLIKNFNYVYNTSNNDNHDNSDAANAENRMVGIAQLTSSVVLIKRLIRKHLTIRE